MLQQQIPIGQVKRDISELVNRVAYGSERIVLTSRGRPKAALISIEDLAKLEALQQELKQAQWQALIVQADRLNETIMARRKGEPLDLQLMLDAARDKLEKRAIEHGRD